MIINAIAPYVLLEAEIIQDEGASLNMIKILGEIGSEDDVVTRVFSDLGVHNYSAYFSQGLHELYEVYCSHKKCLSCDIGSSIIT